MAEEIVKLGDDALKAVETIRGNRNETVTQTIGRILSTGKALAEETAKGAKILIKDRNGTMREVPL